MTLRFSICAAARRQITSAWQQQHAARHDADEDHEHAYDAEPEPPFLYNREVVVITIQHRNRDNPIGTEYARGADQNRPAEHQQPNTKLNCRQDGDKHMIDYSWKIFRGGVTVSVQDLETAVKQLPADKLDEFARWFEEFIADVWDQRIEDDIRAGRLERAGQRADAEFEAGRCTPL